MAKSLLGEPPIATWIKMRRVIRERFVSLHFQSDLQCLQTLREDVC